MTFDWFTNSYDKMATYKKQRQQSSICNNQRNIKMLALNTENYTKQMY